MKGRVLIIDSDRAHSEALQAQLRLSGYEVITESAVLDGLGAADTTAASVIITDAIADGHTSFQSLEELRVRHPHAPIIVTANNSSIETAVRAIQEQGAYHYFEKPVDPEKFLTVLESATVLAETKRENEILRRELRDRLVDPTA